MLLASSVVLTIGGIASIAAGAALLAGSMAIAIGAALLLVGGLAILVGGTALLTGSVAVLAAAIVLSSSLDVIMPASVLLGKAGAVIAEGGAALLLGSIAALAAAIPMTAAGAALWLASWPFSRGIRALAVDSVRLLEIGSNFAVGGTNLLAGVLSIAGAAGQLVALAGALSMPFDNLFSVFTVSTQASALGLLGVLDDTVRLLGDYARSLEDVAHRISLALRRALPSSPIALLGLSSVRAATIATTQITNQTQQMQDDAANQERVALMRAQSAQLSDISDKLSALVTAVRDSNNAGPGTPSGIIIELLRTYLPDIADNTSSSNLSSTNWLK